MWGLLTVKMAIPLNNLHFLAEEWITKKINLFHLSPAAAVLSQVLWRLLQRAAMMQNQENVTPACCYIQSRLN